MSPALILVSLTSICSNHCLINFLAHKQGNHSYGGEWPGHDSPPNVNIHSAPGKAGWGWHQQQHVSEPQPGPLSVAEAMTIRAGSECDCGHQRRTLEPLVNQKHRRLVQLIQLSYGEVIFLQQSDIFLTCSILIVHFAHRDLFVPFLKTWFSLKSNFKCVPWSQWGPVNPGSHTQLKEPHSPWQCARLPQEGSCSLLVQWSSVREQPGTVLEDSAGEPRSYSWMKDAEQEKSIKRRKTECLCPCNSSRWVKRNVIAAWERKYLNYCFSKVLGY